MTITYSIRAGKHDSFDVQCAIAPHLQENRIFKNANGVVMLCMDLAPDRRGFLIKAAEMGMANDEYVFILLGMRSLGFVSNGLAPLWEDADPISADGMDNVAKLAAQYMIVLDLNSEGVNQTYMTYFKSNVLARVRADPLFCKTSECLSNSNKSVTCIFT
ncbi:hypothetical protein ANCCEY_12343 [Ancylostoma ceylanicum]|uniref:Receptor ligand binding region domain-containing protein n=1 Tax=Ancylostoma ceylanicum TaxID=53326 RepID=A0A0D6LBF6_9BILA|nr:hypothetical protein ANCCEY_12343 [Ancylostoma ceylanicum]